jgi:hypothetical protein
MLQPQGPWDKRLISDGWRSIVTCSGNSASHGQRSASLTLLLQLSASCHPFLDCHFDHTGKNEPLCSCVENAAFQIVSLPQSPMRSPVMLNVGFAMKRCELDCKATAPLIVRLM